MGKKTKQGKDAKKISDAADGIYRNITSLSNQISPAFMSTHAQQLWAQVDIPKSPTDQAKLFRDLFATTQTDLQQNDTDPYGDGDQRQLPNESECSIFRNAWSHGGDMEELLMGRSYSPFALACVTGNKIKVEAMLKAIANDDVARTQMLEFRESVMRLSPLLLTVALSKHPGVIHTHTRVSKEEMDFLGVAEVLLRYGARPDAKDVAGKNVTHYGAGSRATEISLKIADWCIEAAKTCQHYGQIVTVQGLSKEEYNGLKGKLGGYLGEQNRRTVYLQIPSSTNTMEIKVLAIQPKNIYFDDKSIIDDPPYKLVDIPDRLGATALFEVIMSERVDIAHFLCGKHQTSLDIVEVSGCTPRTMVFGTPGMIISSTMQAVRDYGIKSQEKSRVCSNCHKTSIPEQTENKFKRCSRCGEVYYCSKECQVADWLVHRMGCVDISKGITLQDPKNGGDNGRICATISRNGNFSGIYCKPQKVGAGELFWIKVQVAGEQIPHLIYDHSRQCSFSYPPGLRGHAELFKKVQAEPVSLGKKCHFKASFDAAGNCTVYPLTAKLLEW